MRLGVPALAAGVVLLAGCGSGGNPAEELADEVQAGLSAANPRIVCTNGDAGRGLDNSVPWHTRYVAVDPAADLDRIVTDAAAAAGHPLRTDTELLESQRLGPRDRNARGTTGPLQVTGVPYRPTTSYLAGRRDGVELQATIVRTGEVVLYCGGDRWADVTTAGPGEAVLVLTAELPER